MGAAGDGCLLLRYPLAVVCAYLVFFVSMKLWLKYIAPLAF